MQEAVPDGMHDRRCTLYVQVTYQFVPFQNEARNDGMKLYHWVQCYKDATGTTRPADDGPYPFAKYNTNAGAYRYDDIEYETIVRPALPESETGWSKVCTPLIISPCMDHAFCAAGQLMFSNISSPSSCLQSTKRLLHTYRKRQTTYLTYVISWICAF